MANIIIFPMEHFSVIGFLLPTNILFNEYTLRQKEIVTLTSETLMSHNSDV